MPFYGHHTCYPILTRPPPFIKCGPELYNIIKRNWAPDELWKFENLMYKHGFSTMNEVDINNLLKKVVPKQPLEKVVPKI
jgi:hypothetical protein